MYFRSAKRAKKGSYDAYDNGVFVIIYSSLPPSISAGCCMSHICHGRSDVSSLHLHDKLPPLMNLSNA